MKSENRPKILIYCHDFPPLQSVAAIRPYSWAKNLPSHDIDVTVLTRDWSENDKNSYPKTKSKVISKESEHFSLIKVKKNNSFKDSLVKIPLIGKVTRKLLTFLELLLRWRFPFVDEKYFLEKQLWRVVSSSEFDLILVTGEPFILFEHVFRIHKEFSIPFILDYRDGWFSDEISLQTRDSILYKIVSRIELKHESKIVNEALHVITVHDSIADHYKKKFPNIRLNVLENGIELASLKEAMAQPRFNLDEKKFNIIYTGIFYPGHRVDYWLNAIQNLCERDANFKRDMTCYFIGISFVRNKNVELVERFSQKYPKQIKMIEPLDHQSSLSAQAQSNLLLKFNVKSQIETGHGTKIYEYAATKRPILTVLGTEDKRTNFFPNRDIQTLCSSVEEIEDSVQEIFSKWINGDEFKTSITDDEINLLSREFQSKRLASIIKQSLDSN